MAPYEIVMIKCIIMVCLGKDLLEYEEELYWGTDGTVVHFFPCLKYTGWG